MEEYFIKYQGEFFLHAHLMWIEYFLACFKMLPHQRNI